MRRLGYFAIGAFAGALLASAAALLFAPASGNKMRSQIQDYAHQVVSDVRSAAAQRRQELETRLIELRSTQQS